MAKQLQPKFQPVIPPVAARYRPLLEAYQELYRDQAAGEISELDFGYRKQILDGNLPNLDKPGLRVVGIPHKHFDVEGVARALIAAAMARIRQRNGQPAMTEAESRELMATLAASKSSAQSARPPKRKPGEATPPVDDGAGSS